jgi:hypothetical protein
MPSEPERYLALHKLHPRAVTLVLVAYEVLRANPDVTGAEFAEWAGVDSAFARQSLRRAKAIIEGVPAPSKREAVGA